MKKRTPAREIAAFVGVDGRGGIAWGTFRESRAACAAEIERIAPAVGGFPPPLRVMPVRIAFDLNRQLDMPLDGPQEPSERD